MGYVVRRFPRFGGCPAGILTAGFFLAYLIALPPHLVHHLFEEDHGQPECPLFAQSQQTPVVQADPSVLTPLAPSEFLEARLPQAALPFADLTIRHSRAPPRSAPFA